jgi:hypothetical protein
MTLNRLKSSTLYSAIVAAMVLIAASWLPIWSSEFHEDGDFWDEVRDLLDDITYDPRHMRDGDGVKAGLLEIMHNNAGFLVRLAMVIGGGVLLGQLLYALPGKEEQDDAIRAGTGAT